MAPIPAAISPSATSRGRVSSRGRMAIITAAAQMPVSIQMFGWSASAWMPQSTPAVTSPARVGRGHRTSGRRIHGSHAKDSMRFVHSSLETTPPVRTTAPAATKAPSREPDSRSARRPVPTPSRQRWTTRATSSAGSGGSWKISQFGG